MSDEGPARRVLESYQLLASASRLEVCGKCDGVSVKPSERGGIEYGRCMNCGGAGLILK